MFHFDPQGEDVIVFVDGGYQFVDVLVFFFFDKRIIDKSFVRQFAYLVEYAVDIGIDAVDNGKACLFYQVLAFVGSNVLFVDIPLLFQLVAFVAQRSDGLFVVHSPIHIGSQYMYQGLFVAV